MRIALEQSDREFLNALHGLGTATVQEICDHVGVTATAVRQRLTRLQAAALISRQRIRGGRGRPHFVYALTEAALKELGDNYSDLALILWRELRRIPETAVRERVVNGVREALIERYGRVVQGNTVGERLNELQAALIDQGFDVEVDRRDALPILRENNCPYPELANSDPSICQLEQEVFERVLGTPMVLSHCCRDGYHCCEFQTHGEEGERGRHGDEEMRR